MGYQYVSDNQEERGFISKDKVLSYVTEEKVFSLVFGFSPVELEYVTSPFRQDDTPSCYFERLGQNKLRFIDHSRKFYPDCFEAVQVYFGLSSFYSTLNYIYGHLIQGKGLAPLPPEKITHEKRDEDTPVVIHPKTRWFTSHDASFWQPLEITRQQLMNDNVFAVSHVSMFNTKKGDISYDVRELCYLYAGFQSNRKKLYFPERKEAKFISTCMKNDVGCIDSLPPRGKRLIITKSYKDCRVIRNTGRYSVWFQSEGTIPDIDLLTSIVKRFDEVIILYDNDDAGIRGAMELAALINSIFPNKSRAIWLPEMLCEKGITDSSDLVKATGGYGELRQFFGSYLI